MSYIATDKRNISALFRVAAIISPIVSEDIYYLYNTTYLRNNSNLRITYSDWVILTSGLIRYRKGQRDNLYVIDYSADGGVTWENDVVTLELDEDNIIINIDEGVTGYRQTIRSGDYCIDHVLTPTGFEGDENIDWENVFIIVK